ncbi:uncharacterized protein JN550_013487 [Neoarthrinium moseri]|uniref:uncharacterized protein n=1 Tax=Neoarthrinium moseri TaxID=1658444 RepID=UPI001FDD9CB7|nr:uncharacterized protein JN550_013487 [Neoarthrinium moseri]KAI1856994.1 hypothetical protein JN550_013487 [Neoarthrinium moseri]
MKITQVPLDESTSLPPSDPDDTTYVSLLHELGTEGCLLDCEEWVTKQAVSDRRTTNPAEKREKWNRIRGLRKESIKKQRQVLQTEARLSNRKLKSKRNPFMLKDLEASTNAGCGCCRFFSAMLGCLLQPPLDLDRETLLLEWVGYNFYLKMQDKRRQKPISFQFFSPSGAKIIIRGLKSANILPGDTSSSASFEAAKDHFKGIAFSVLPKTFQDAVLITKQLGVRYLWIDSLCIIQDSGEDWAVESSKMADIYQKSHITIAAVSSSDSRGGCLFTTKLSDLYFRVQFNDSEILIAVRCYDRDGIVEDIDSFKDAYPALTRAWIYQERMLSRRILYYTYRELQFECREHKACECGNPFIPPHPVPTSPAYKAMLQAKNQYAELGKHYGVKGRYSDDQACEHWQKTVMQYTKLHLTRSSDKLPALSGCAKDIGRLTGDEYLAGFWRAKLAEELLWVVNAPVNQPRTVNWRAPSWSWASVDTTNGIDYIYPLETRYKEAFRARIEGAECVPATIDKTGAVKSGCIRLRTSLCPVYLRRICLALYEKPQHHTLSC